MLWSNRNYRLLLSGSAVTNLGDGVAAVAMPWLLFAVPADVWTDRADRRRLMVRADCARLALTLGVVAMILSVPTTPIPDGRAGLVATLAAVAFLLGTAAVVRGNAAQTLLPSVVRRDVLERATGQMWSAEQGKRCGADLLAPAHALAPVS